jgi:hypothetical protein
MIHPELAALLPKGGFEVNQIVSACLRAILTKKTFVWLFPNSLSSLRYDKLFGKSQTKVLLRPSKYFLWRDAHFCFKKAAKQLF